MTLFNPEAFSTAIHRGAIEWNRHALERMMERGISRRDVIEVILSGEPIEEYVADYPYPSVLMLGNSDGAALHVVVSFNSEQGTLYVITAYVPDTMHFLDDYKTRRN